MQYVQEIRSYRVRTPLVNENIGLRSSGENTIYRDVLFQGFIYLTPSFERAALPASSKRTLIILQITVTRPPSVFRAELVHMCYRRVGLGLGN